MKTCVITRVAFENCGSDREKRLSISRQLSDTSKLMKVKTVVVMASQLIYVRLPPLCYHQICHKKRENSHLYIFFIIKCNNEKMAYI